ncbi:hypothetical protein [Hymenobacter negativus]|uniref:HEPN AbiU2-like domain-containing protein n=1 Tax=Hymenobacter negativus TaxID=2795026 RepID=A0ABS0Q9E7_9BACT|nr:hypothetical protein [Hymenobacter negativus]MBH8559245.1 hypothetical protein [Hymenobacter negativus]
MEEATPIMDYLPNSFKHQNEQDYVSFLWDAFASNYEAGQYQFALLAYHMLFMSGVYCSLWQIRTSRQSLFANALLFHQDEEVMLEATSPFVFSKAQESNVFKFMRLIDCEKQHIGKFTKLVKDRNSIAHSNGNIFYQTKPAADIQIAEVLRQLAVIQELMRPILHSCLSQFLLESHNPEEREYSLDEDQIREVLIHANYFSAHDIACCLQFDIESLREHEHFEAMKSLFESLCTAYAEEV